MSLECVDWDIADVTVINFVGRITLGEGSKRLRKAVRDALDRGRMKVLLNFDEVVYVDSSGLGELVMSRKAVMDAGGKLKLMKLNQITRDLFQVTRLYTVFDVFADQESALA